MQNKIVLYSATVQRNYSTPTKAMRQNFPQILQPKIVNVINSLPTHYSFNQAEYYEGNRFVFILGNLL